MGNKLIRHGIYAVDHILCLVRADAERCVVDGTPGTVNTKSLRMRMFAEKGVTCGKCGIPGAFFATERSGGSKDVSAHFNLYALKDGVEVLMTRDHIVPVARGGKETMENMQPMCSVCNGRKGCSTKETAMKIIVSELGDLNIVKRSESVFVLKLGSSVTQAVYNPTSDYGVDHWRATLIPEILAALASLHGKRITLADLLKAAGADGLYILPENGGSEIVKLIMCLNLSPDLLYTNSKATRSFMRSFHDHVLQQAKATA
jgi:hypothetical protein